MTNKSIFRSVRSFVYRRGFAALPDPVAVGILHWMGIGRWPNMRHPKTFSERLQHRKLYVRDDRWPALADKVAAKAIVSKVIGPDWITPTLWHGTILPDRPPTLPIIVKSAHGSGRTLYVKDDADWAKARAASQEWLRPYNAFYREWVYETLTPQIIIEPDLSGGNPPILDYKFYVFGQKVRVIQLHTGRLSEHRKIIYDADWNRLPVEINHPNDPRDYPPPHHLREMIAAAEALATSIAIDFVRVDFYDLEEHARFGEMTFFPMSGTGRIIPEAFNRTMGDWWGEAEARRMRELSV